MATNNTILQMMEQANSKNTVVVPAQPIQISVAPTSLGIKINDQIVNDASKSTKTNSLGFLDTISVDKKSVQAINQSGSAELPTGSYHATIKELSFFPPKTNEKQVKARIRFEITSGAYAMNVIDDYVELLDVAGKPTWQLGAKFTSRAKAICEAYKNDVNNARLAALEIAKTNGDFKEIVTITKNIIDDFSIGNHVLIIEVVQKPYNDKMYSNVSKTHFALVK